MSYYGGTKINKNTKKVLKESLIYVLVCFVLLVCGSAVVCLFVLFGGLSPLEISTLFWFAWAT